MTSRPNARAVARRLAAMVGAILACTLAADAADFSVSPGVLAEVVVRGIPRPLQLALAPGGSLVVLSHGVRGDAAAEMVTVPLDTGQLPIDGASLPRSVIPFPETARQAVLGSLAIAPRTGQIVLGEENGHRIYRLTPDGQLESLAVGLHHLVGGSGIAFDHDGRLVVVDFVSIETQLRSEHRLPPALEWLAGEGYQGPLVFRLDLREERPLPRRLDLAAPFFPRGWPRGESPPASRFVAAAAGPHNDIVVLDSLGDVVRLTPDGQRHLLARLGPGHYHRTNMAVAPDGTVVVSTGFHIRRLLSISPAGAIALIAADLGDPNGLAIDAAGAIYLAETAHHRILRLTPGPGLTPLPPSRR